VSQSSWILLAIALVVGSDLLFVGLELGLGYGLGPLPSAVALIFLVSSAISTLLILESMLSTKMNKYLEIMD